MTKPIFTQLNNLITDLDINMSLYYSDPSLGSSLIAKDLEKIRNELHKIIQLRGSLTNEQKKQLNQIQDLLALIEDPLQPNFEQKLDQLLTLIHSFKVG